jgi:GNAT superfamily N-acetyltransferase
MDGIDPSAIVLKPVNVTFLEMHHKPPAEFQENGEARFRLWQKPIDVETYRYYYSAVGKQHFWLDRMIIAGDELFRLINAPNIEIYVMSIHDQPAGYAEFIIEKKFTEILYFGIMPAFIGKGWGKYALDWAIHKAWENNPEWIQLNTCELDHPHAISNYKKRGFQEVRTEIQQRKILIA